MLSFMDAHRCFGEVECNPYQNCISVAASAIGGEPRIAVHGRTKQGRNIGGLMGADEAQELVNLLESAIAYAEQIARDQRVAEIPALERRLEKARRDA